MQNMPLRAAWVGAAVLAVALLLHFAADSFALLSIKGDNALEDVFSRLGILFVLSVFAERTVEIYATVYRHPEKEALITEIKTQGILQQLPEALETDKELSKQQASTGKYSILLALLIGILFGLSGISIIGSLVEKPESVHGLVRLLDILLVGGMIAGGSQPIHQIMETITDTFSLTRANLKPPPSVSQ